MRMWRALTRHNGSRRSYPANLYTVLVLVGCLCPSPSLPADVTASPPAGRPRWSRCRCATDGEVQQHDTAERVHGSGQTASSSCVTHSAPISETPASCGMYAIGQMLGGDLAAMRGKAKSAGSRCRNTTDSIWSGWTENIHCVNQGHSAERSEENDNRAKKLHWSRDEVKSEALVQDDDVPTLLEHLKRTYHEKHGKRATEKDLAVWDACLRSLRVDCTEAKMLGDAHRHQVVRLSGLFLTRKRHMSARRGNATERSRRTIGAEEGGDRVRHNSMLRETRKKKGSSLPFNLTLRSGGATTGYTVSRCAAGSGCSVTPSYVDPKELLTNGDVTAWRCKKHCATGRDVNVRVRERCVQQDCSKQASFGSPAQRQKLRCSAHRLASDVLLNRGHMCVGKESAGDEAREVCQRRGIFGIPGNRTRHCSRHRLAGEEDLVHTRCRAPGCRTQASFGDATAQMPRFCSRHKLAGHVRARGNGYVARRGRGVCKSPAPLAATSTGGRRVQPRHAPQLAPGAGALMVAAPRTGVAGGRCGTSGRRISKLVGRGAAAELAAQIYECRFKSARGRHGSMRQLSRDLGVSAKTISNIWNRHSWVKVTRPLWTPAETLAYAASASSRSATKSTLDFGGRGNAAGAVACDDEATDGGDGGALTAAGGNDFGSGAWYSLGASLCCRDGDQNAPQKHGNQAGMQLLDMPMQNMPRSDSAWPSPEHLVCCDCTTPFGFTPWHLAPPFPSPPPLHLPSQQPLLANDPFSALTAARGLPGGAVAITDMVVGM